MADMVKYHLILNLRERTMVFWTLAFPLLLGVFFYFGIGGIDEASQFDAIPVAVAADDGETADRAQADDGEMAYRAQADPADGAETISEDGVSADAETVAELPAETELFRELLDGVSGQVVELVYVKSRVAALRKLEKGQVAGVFDLTGDRIHLTVDGSGMEESILKALLDGFEQQMGIVSDIRAELDEEIQVRKEALQTASPEEGIQKAAELEESIAYAQETMQRLAEQAGQRSAEYVEEVSLGGRNVSAVSPYYFALLAMACLYMCFLGELAARRTQANLSGIGKRICVSPVHRLRMVIANGVSAYVIALVNISLILLFLTRAVHGRYFGASGLCGRDGRHGLSDRRDLRNPD